MAALALWAVALPTVLLSLAAPRPGVVHAPTTVVALLYATVLAILTGPTQQVPLAPAQARRVYP